MLENVFSEKKVADFRPWLAWATRFVIVSHTSPDGDAVGSSLAMYQYLKGLDKDVSVILPDSIPDCLEWLPGAHNIIYHKSQEKKAVSLLKQADVIICLDFNCLRRVAGMANALAESPAKKMLIDHHPLPEPFCDITLSYPSASSTCELVFQFLCKLGEYRNMTPEMAECIYTGMMTDTGGFTYNSSQSRTFVIVSKLIDKDIDKDEIYRRVFHNYSVNRFRIMGYLLEKKMQVFPQWHTALMVVSSRDMTRFGISPADTEGFVNLPLQIKGVMMSAFLKQDAEKGFIKISMRSVGTVPCNKFVSQFYTGGGHLNAAGGEFHGTLSDAEQIFMNGMDAWSKITNPEIAQLFKD